MTNKFGFSSFNSWDPLKKAMVGSAFKKNWFWDHPDPKVRDAMQRINEETREDLDNLQRVLEERGVEVIRTPESTYSGSIECNSILEYMQHENEVPKCRMSPRDEFIVLGENLVLGRPGNLYNRWCDPNDTVIKDKAPWAGCDDFIDSCTEGNAEGNPWFLGHYNMEPDEMPRLDGPCMVRTGRDISVDIEIQRAAGKTFCDRWIHEYNEKFGYDFRAHKIRFGRHSDGLMSIPKPGVILSSVAVTNYQETYPDWKVIKVPKPENDYIHKFWDIKQNSKYIDENGYMHKKYWVAGEEGNTALSEFIDLWFNENVGYAFETNFDVNTLSIDEKTVVTSGNNDYVAEELAKEGIEVIVAPMRHRYFWDGGIHCNTVDLYREGVCKDYFPERGDTHLDFGNPYDKEIAERDNNRNL